MNLAFGRMKRRELREAAEVATRAFDDYEYFTNWFPEKQSRNRIQSFSGNIDSGISLCGCRAR